jgi:hypothetical protein
MDEAEDENSTALSAAISPATHNPSLEGEAGVIGFWKRLSKFDVSQTSAPGQMIIPIQFRTFFEPLALNFDRTDEGGARQYDRTFPLTFKDDGYQIEVEDARVILYEPAADHPRPNKELRFTFHDREILNRLRKDDVLVFQSLNDRIVVQRKAAGSMGPGRFASL